MFENIFSSHISSLLEEKMGNEYTELLRESLAQAQVVCEQANAKFQLEQWEDWNLSQDTGILTLSNQEPENSLEAKVQIIGTYSFESETWKWAWENDSIEELLKSDSKRVQAYGTEKKIEDLTLGHWEASELDAWNMCALSLKLCGGVGMYGANFGSGRLFVLLKSIESINIEKSV